MNTFRINNAVVTLMYHLPTEDIKDSWHGVLGEMVKGCPHVAIRIVPTSDENMSVTLTGELRPLPEDSPLTPRVTGMSPGMCLQSVEDLLAENARLKARVAFLEGAASLDEPYIREGL